MKVFLFILRHSPYQGVKLPESLDMVLTFAAFDQPVRVLLLDDGVFLLKSGQNPQQLGLKPVLPLLEALEFYDVEGLWVEQESLLERGLGFDGLALPAKTIKRSEVAGFIAQADVVVNC